MTDEDSSLVLIGNLVPAIGIVGVAVNAFSRNDEVNLRNRTGGNGFRPGLYRVEETQKCNFNRRPCRRLTVHRIGEQGPSKPAFDVVAIAIE